MVIWFPFCFLFVCLDVFSSYFACLKMSRDQNLRPCLCNKFFFRNYLITEIAETERRQWFKELLLLDDFLKTGKTVWIGSDFQVQGRTGH